MKTKAFKLLPCIFCTIGYNCYIAGHNVTAKGYQSLVKLQKKKPITKEANTSSSKP
ncbi:hypothetical protein [Colwellia psychrerythraea]|uniref:Uncharacterized protein n=1 Tax=Colwellia psychrerythraea TaxID=28229 RepID=A0A099KKB2_COLPS|nr:hypothetical protein [Colwellia psychrerythraea]KGJ90013.1 hypothetical protein ND2E_3569 [Colwellia psychrerythraea]